MRYYMDENLWTIFSGAAEEWASKHKVDPLSTQYSFQEANEIVQRMACSVGVEPVAGQFSAHFLSVYSRHLRLQQAIEGKSVDFLLCSVEKLWNSIGNRYNFRLDSGVIQKLLDIGSCIEYVSKSPKNESLERMILSAKRLSKFGDGITVSKGSLRFDTDFSDRIFQYLNKKMAQLGGMEFVAHYEKRAQMANLYCRELDRYLIFRQDYIGKSQEPVHFLLNLAARHFRAHPARKWEYQKDLHDDIIRVATDFLEVCDLQGNSGIAYSMMDPREVTYHLVDELFFYKMCIPSQYSFRFILASLKYLIREWFDEAGRKYSYRDYYAIAEFFLSRNWWEEDKRFLSDEEIHQNTRVARYKLKEILRDISLPVESINTDFNSFDAPSNFFEYPLIYDSKRGYCCYDRILCGYGFLLRIYKLIRNKKRDLDSLQGHALEKWLHEKMDKKGYDVKSGKYPAASGLSEGECDFVLEDDHVCFMELKKQEVMNDFNSVDDVSLFGALGNGMIRAQKQCFAHELYLRTNGSIDLSDGMVIRLEIEKLPATKVSICFGEHFYISSKAYVVLLLKTILNNGEINAKDTERQKELEAFNIYSSQILDIVEKHNTLLGRKAKIDEISSCSLFCSLQQILMAMWNTSSQKDFLDIIEEWRLRINGSADQYLMLFEKLNREPDSVSQAMFEFVKKRNNSTLLVS